MAEAAIPAIRTEPKNFAAAWIFSVLSAIASQIENKTLQQMLRPIIRKISLDKLQGKRLAGMKAASWAQAASLRLPRTF